LPEDEHAFEVYYKRAEAWPEESLTRIAALGV
jgi:hypothetical protein